MARNIFYGGTVFFFLLLVALTFDTNKTLPKRDNSANLTPAVIAGKKIWETRNCIGCHTLLGEGAYYAPELGNVGGILVCREARREPPRLRGYVEARIGDHGRHPALRRRHDGWVGRPVPRHHADSRRYRGSPDENSVG